MQCSLYIIAASVSRIRLETFLLDLRGHESVADHEFRYSQSLDTELFDLQRPQPRPADRQTTNNKSVDCQRPNGHGAECEGAHGQSANRL